jgi:aminoglycoside phosphotransferase (APT) family kinase protein
MISPRDDAVAHEMQRRAMPDADLSLLHSVVLGQFPELQGLPWRALTESWDSVALDVGGRTIFKFPRDQGAAAALAREARVLATLRGKITLPVPDMTCLAGPPVFSWHPKIPGQHLLTRDYEALPEVAKERLGRDLGQFYAELHRVDPDYLAASGALPVAPWGAVERIRASVFPLLPDRVRPDAEAVLDAFAGLPPDPYGDVFGYFDGHGWNMAFDHDEQRLNGIYDFGDSGLGPLHQDFIYSSMISADLTARVIAAYEIEAGRPIDRWRVDVLTGAHRLWELAEVADYPDHIGMMLQAVIQWHADRLRSC